MRNRHHRGSQPPRVYVVSGADPNAEPQLVTADYVVRRGDYFMHDMSDIDQGCRAKLDQLRRLRESVRLRRIRDELRSLGEYRNGVHTLEFADDDRMYLNAWLSDSAVMRDESAVRLKPRAALPEVVAAYEFAIAHGKQTPRVMRIAKQLLKIVASGLYQASYLRDFDRKHGYSGTYQEDSV